MKSYLSLLFTLAFAFSFFGQKIDLQPEKNVFNVLQKSNNKITVKTSIKNLNFSVLKGNSMIFSDLSLNGYFTNHKVGSPDLPTLNKLIDIPYDATIEINILSQNEETINLNTKSINKIGPAQPSISKSDDASLAPFYYDADVYNADQFITPEIAEVVRLGKMRGHQLGRLEICPFKYNPVTNILKVISEIELEIKFIGANHSLTDDMHSKYYSHHFNSSFNQLINHDNSHQKDMLTTYPVKYVIVSDPSFQSALQPFVEWKTKKGFTVIEAYTNDPAVGNTTTSIKAYLENLYNAGTINDPAPSYLLIVGDVQQVPAFDGDTGNHVTDLFYCEYDGGGDFYPELYYGRFSATNVTECQAMVDKTLEYEKYTFPDPSFLGNTVLISGVDASMAPTYGNGQINYGTDYYFNPAHSIASQTYLYPASGNSGAQILQDVNNGACFVNYTAHGYDEGWADPSFTCSDVYNMTNYRKCPLMIGNCCQSNKFDEPECFGEALLRVPNKGAIGYIGGSNNTYWNEDYWWAVGSGSISANPTYDPSTLGAYDKTFHENGEAQADWHITNAQMMLGGNLAVTQAGPSLEEYYYEIYHLIGDPSLMTYYGVPSAMNVTHMNAVPIGTSSLYVMAEPDAYVSISLNGTLLDAQLTDASGSVTLNFTPFSTIDTADVVVTKQNKQPYQGTVNIITTSAPFVAYDSHVNIDATGNNDGLVDYNEQITLDVTLANFGSINANGVTAQLITSNPNVSIIDDFDTWGTILSSDTKLVSNAFSVQISNDIIDQEIINYELVISDNSSNTWSSFFSMTVNAPVLEVQDHTISDVNGNGNGRIEAGETVDIIIPSNNAGSSSCTSLLGTLSCTSPYVTITNNTFDFGQLAAQTNASSTFEVIIDGSTPFGEQLDFTYLLQDGAYSESISFTEVAGLFSEDFETGDYSMFSWNVISSNPWSIDDTEVYEGSYSSVSADIGNNSSSTMEIDVDVLYDGTLSFMKKVSSEDNYDYLQFYIDGQLQGEWSGEVDWSPESYFVTAGQHTFTWIYDKDQYVQDGDDAAWVDYILFPPIDHPSLSVEEHDLFTEFNIYPNPSNGSLNISVNSPLEKGVSICIYDTKGRIILQQEEKTNVGFNSFNYNLNKIANGLYLINLSDGINSISRPIIIRK